MNLASILRGKTAAKDQYADFFKKPVLLSEAVEKCPNIKIAVERFEQKSGRKLPSELRIMVKNQGVMKYAHCVRQGENAGFETITVEINNTNSILTFAHEFSHADDYLNGPLGRFESGLLLFDKNRQSGFVEAGKGWLLHRILRSESKKYFASDSWTEGRAYYMGKMLVTTPPKRANDMFYAMTLGSVALSLSAWSLLALPFHLPETLLAIGFGWYAQKWIRIGAKNWLFYNSICTIAKKIGSDTLAYRITADRIPENLRQILFPLNFYREEIEKALSEKNAKN